MKSKSHIRNMPYAFTPIRIKHQKQLKLSKKLVLPTLVSPMRKSEGYMIRLEKSQVICSLEAAVVVDSTNIILKRGSMPMRSSECSLEVDYSIMEDSNREGSARQLLSNKMPEVVTDIIMVNKEDKESNKTPQHY